MGSGEKIMTQKELIAWMDDVQARIGKVLNIEGLSAQVLEVIQSPSIVTYKIKLLEPTKAKIDQFLALSKALEQEIGEFPIRIQAKAGFFVVEIPSPVPVSPHADLFLNYVKYPNICIGYDTDVQPVLVDLSRFPSLMFVAPPRAGKTSAVRSIMYSLLKILNEQEENISVIVCAEKFEYWRAFSNKLGVVGVYSEFKEMELILKTISTQLSDKARVGERFNPPVFLVVDDLLRVLAQTTGLDTSIAEIASTGGSVGAYLFLITQSAGSNAGTGGIKVEDNIAARVVYKTTSATAAARSTGSDAKGVESLTTRHGDSLLILGTESLRMTTGFVDDTDIVTLPSTTTGSKFIQNLKLNVSAPLKISDKVEPIKQIIELPEPVSTQSLTISRITPPRELTEEEAEHLRNVVAHYNSIGKPLSNNRLLEMLFGGKNGTYSRYLRTALGG